MRCDSKSSNNCGIKYVWNMMMAGDSGWKRYNEQIDNHYLISIIQLSILVKKMGESELLGLYIFVDYHDNAVYHIMVVN